MIAFVVLSVMVLASLLAGGLMLLGLRMIAAILITLGAAPVLVILAIFALMLVG